MVVSGLTGAKDGRARQSFARPSHVINPDTKKRKTHKGNHMQNLFKLPFGLLAACLLLAAGPAHAAKMPKVDICHFSLDEGIYKKSSVSGNALQEHLDHGDVIPGVDNEPPLPDLDDDCFAIIVPDPIARAYIDVDRNGLYDGNTDVDIAVLLDTDGSGGLSVGDTIELGQYPKDFNPCPAQTLLSCDLGTFNNDIHIITFLLPSTPGFQYSAISGDLRFDIGDGGAGDALFLTDEGGGATQGFDANFFDIHVEEFSNDLRTVQNSPLWDPSDALPTSEAGYPSGTTDDHFINVIIY